MTKELKEQIDRLAEAFYNKLKLTSQTIGDHAVAHIGVEETFLAGAEAMHGLMSGEIEVISRVSDGHLNARAADNAEWGEWREKVLEERDQLRAENARLREALEKIDLNKTQTVYNSSKEFMKGANVAFGQSAEIARAALGEGK